MDGLHTTAGKKAEGKKPRPLEYLAVWQGICFFLLICVIWAIAVLDSTKALFGELDAKSQWVEAAFLTACTVIVGFIMIANTYVQEKRILKGYVSVCAYCRKARLDDQHWQQLELYIEERTQAAFTHGICPDCSEKVIDEYRHSSARRESNISG